MIPFGSTNFMKQIATLSLLLIILLIPSVQADEKGAVFYREKVHPILEQNCFKCHGGEDKLKGEFRVTSREGLLRGGEYGPGYDEADPAKSIFLEMISYKDADYQMPPKAKLPAEQIAILDEWVKMGAPYDSALEIKGDPSEAHRGFTLSDDAREWWAYRPLSRSAPPKPRNTDWGKNEIDAFILDKLEKNGLQPNPDAEPAALIRRVTYDLTGLPPTPSQVDDFVAKFKSAPETAYDTLLEELLASPRYGEKWARHWLDLLRYAESNGFERDNPKPVIWKFRDYVINAFNSDIPYDQFVTEQLAGDEIPNRTWDSLVATGYHRLMQWDDEPADRKQHIYDVLADNVQITSEAFLATTVGCARCHDHKADPISQKDYYAFMDLFHGITHYRTEGTIHHWSTEDQKQKFAIEREKNIAALESEVASLDNRIREYLRGEKLIKNQGKAAEQTFVRSGRLESPAQWEFTLKKPTPDWKEVGFRDKMWNKGPGGFGTATPNHAKKTAWTTSDIWLRTGFGLKVLPDTLTLELYHDEDVEVYINGVEVFRATGYTSDYEYFPLDQKAIDALQTGRNVIAIHCKQTGGGQYIDAGLRTVASDSSKLEDIIRTNGNKKLITQITKHFEGKNLYQSYLDKKKEIENWKNRKAGEPLNIVQERGETPQPLHIHLRGSAHAPGEQVYPGFPAVLGKGTNEPIPAAATPVSWTGGKTSGRRLALAKWITSEDNPLTSRVMANRIWQHHFGRGITPSTSDFGTLGEMPSHPELLDWLALRFQSSGWKIKDMHRLILKSRSYRMSSAPNSGNSQIDPGNHYFWRNNMRRLTAEEIRDSILTVSGKLVEQIGGDWVYPPLPQEVLATASRPGKGWPVSADENNHFRRSIYIHVKRSLRHPMMTDFDQADTDSPCAVRFATTVPNQALMMLNSKFVNDHAAIMAERIQGYDGDERDLIASTLKMVTQTEPDDRDVDRCLDLYQRFQSDAGLSPDDAMKRIALLALNLNQFLYLD